MFLASGLTQLAFCERHGVSYHNFRHRYQRSPLFRGKRRGTPASTVAPVTRRDPEAVTSNDWRVRCGGQCNECPAHTPVEVIIGEETEEGELPRTIVRLWPIEPRAVDLYEARGQKRRILSAIKDAAVVLWERRVEGQKAVEYPRPRRETPKNGYYSEHQDRFLRLFRLPAPNQTKFDQIYDWAVEQAAANTSDR